MGSCVYRFGYGFALFSDHRARNPIRTDEESYSGTEFARFQRRTLESDLQDMARRCHERLLHAFRLLNPAAPFPKNHQRYGPYDVDRLIYPWDRLCGLPVTALRCPDRLFRRALPPRAAALAQLRGGHVHDPLHHPCQMDPIVARGGPCARGRPPFDQPCDRGSVRRHYRHPERKRP